MTDFDWRDLAREAANFVKKVKPNERKRTYFPYFQEGGPLRVRVSADRESDGDIIDVQYDLLYFLPESKEKPREANGPPLIRLSFGKGRDGKYANFEEFDWFKKTNFPQEIKYYFEANQTQRNVLSGFKFVASAVQAAERYLRAPVDLEVLWAGEKIKVSSERLKADKGLAIRYAKCFGNIPFVEKELHITYLHKHGFGWPFFYPRHYGSPPYVTLEIKVNKTTDKAAYSQSMTASSIVQELKAEYGFSEFYNLRGAKIMKFPITKVHATTPAAELAKFTDLKLALSKPKHKAKGHFLYDAGINILPAAHESDEESRKRKRTPADSFADFTATRR